MRASWAAIALAFVGGCVVAPAPRYYREPPPPPPRTTYYAPPPQPVAAPAAYDESAPEPTYVSEDVEPPIDEPAPVAVEYAPPPMRVEPPPPVPYDGAVWIGGYWHWWDGEWIWARGRWVRPPTTTVIWTVPYYEYRSGLVVYVPGYWRPANRVFVVPARNVYIPVQRVRPGIIYARPVGTEGVFVPAPPGSRPGVIVSAPVGTPPAVVVSAPPVVRAGMVVRPVAAQGRVEVVAPAGVTRNGVAVQRSVPNSAPRAAALPAAVSAPPPPVRAGGVVGGRGVISPIRGDSPAPSRPPNTTTNATSGPVREGLERGRPVQSVPGRPADADRMERGRLDREPPPVQPGDRPPPGDVRPAPSRQDLRAPGAAPVKRDAAKKPPPPLKRPPERREGRQEER